jgi:hypothetical protein
MVNGNARFACESELLNRRNPTATINKPVRFAGLRNHATMPAATNVHPATIVVTASVVVEPRVSPCASAIPPAVAAAIAPSPTAKAIHRV